MHVRVAVVHTGVVLEPGVAEAARLAARAAASALPPEAILDLHGPTRERPDRPRAHQARESESRPFRFLPVPRERKGARESSSPSPALPVPGALAACGRVHPSRPQRGDLASPTAPVAGRF